MKNKKKFFAKLFFLYVIGISVASVGLITLNFYNKPPMSFKELIDFLPILLIVGFVAIVVYYLRYCARHNNDEK
ncbi:MAG: hypothetical protein MJ010_00420 [Paludibacteraceae bacterium]|nr:hypothetical protein [Paludibacteraceae bacterium]